MATRQIVFKLLSAHQFQRMACACGHCRIPTCSTSQFYYYPVSPSPIPSTINSASQNNGIDIGYVVCCIWHVDCVVCWSSIVVMRRILFGTNECSNIFIWFSFVRESTTTMEIGKVRPLDHIVHEMRKIVSTWFIHSVQFNWHIHSSIEICIFLPCCWCCPIVRRALFSIPFIHSLWPMTNTFL